MDDLRLLLESDQHGNPTWRWTRENGWPGGCRREHGHRSPEVALECFLGDGR